MALDAPAPASSVSTGSGGVAQEAVPGEILVRYAVGVGPSTRVSVRERAGVVLRRALLLPRLELVRALPHVPVAAALSDLNDDPRVRYAEPNFVDRVLRTPNDPLFDQQWALRNSGQPVNGRSGMAGADIAAPAAWDVATGSRGVKVAVIDTGMDYAHPDLRANVWRNPGEAGTGEERNGIDDDQNGFVDDLHGWNFVDKNSYPEDSRGTGPVEGHGTAVTGIIGGVADNDRGASGINWNASLIALKACRTGQVTNAAEGCLRSDVLDAMTYAGRVGADVVNLSLSGGAPGTVYRDVAATMPNTLFVAAAGNAGTDNDAEPQFPCSLDLANVVCAAATDQRDELISPPAHPWASNYGASTVDLGAPGTNNLTTSVHDRDFFVDSFDGSARWDYTAPPTQADPTRWRLVVSTWGNSVGGLLEDSESANYANDADVRMTLDYPIDLAGQRGCVAVVAAGLDTEPSKDFMRVEAATARDGPYTELARWSGSTDNRIVDFHAPLGPLDGGRVYLRLRLTSDGVNTADGAHVSSVTVQCSYTLFGGTSSATPHVAGAAALVKSHMPALSVAALRERLLRTVDPLPSLAGKTVTGGRLNVARALTADLDAPTVAVTARPPERSGSDWASFDFSASEAASTLECRLDGGAFASCGSPKRYEGLGDGEHTFHVRATDPAGNAGSPAEARWTIDTAPPTVTISSGPAGSTTSRAASFTFGASEAVDAYECRVDAAAFASCASPVSYEGLALGSHTFSLRARDAAGNWSAAPATRTWTITDPATAGDGAGATSAGTTSGGAATGGDAGPLTVPALHDPRPSVFGRPSVVVAIPAQTLHAVRRRGLVTLATTRGACPCRLVHALHADAGVASTIALKQRAGRTPLSIGRVAVVVRRPATVRAVLRLTQRARSRLRNTRELRGWLHTTVTDRYARAAVARRRVRLRG